VYNDYIEAQTEKLAEKHNVFVMSGGFMNLGGLNSRNVDKVAKAIHSVVTSK